MKYLTYSNSGCIGLLGNLYNSLRHVHGLNDESFQLHVESLDPRTSIEYVGRPISWVPRNTFTLAKDGEELSNYQNWSFDPSSNFSKIVSWKWKLIKKFYDEHGEFIFVDTDVFFRRNPEKLLRSYKKDFCIQSDLPGSRMCTGFMYFAGKNPTCDYIIKGCAMNHMDDQIILNKVLESKPEIHNQIQILDPSLFPNGHVFYKTNIDRKLPYIVHNNHMIGAAVKQQAFLDNDMWINTSLFDDEEHRKIMYE